jgi:hypothetical protein
MSIGSKKKDKDKDAKGASGREASTNYSIGTVEGRGDVNRNTITSGKQEPPSTTTQDISTTQRITSSSPTSQDQISPESLVTGTTPSSTSKEVHHQYRYQHDYQQQQRWDEQRSGLNRTLDETRDSIRKSTDEARRDIPRYTQTVNDYNEEAIKSAIEIAESYLESQKEIINSLQSAWLPQIDAANRAFTCTWMSPRNFTQAYAHMVSNLADNWVAASRLANNAIFANMEAFRTTLQQTRDNTKEISRININTARSLEQTARDVSENYASSSTSSGFHSTGKGEEGYSFNQGVVREQQHQQIPSVQNEEDTQNVLEAQNHIAGQRREQTITDMPTAAAVGQALKDMKFPADKKRILLFLQERSNTNPDYQKMMSLLNSVEDRHYENVSDVTNTAGLVQ